MLRILIADDERDARDKMVRCIDKLQNGFSIIGTASDGFEAYHMTRDLQPDIVLIDIEMPGMNGLEVIKKIKSEEINTSFIIISSYQKFTYAQDALRLNVEDYLLKPFLPGDVCNAIYKATKHMELLRTISLVQRSPDEPEPELTLAQRMGSVLVYPFEQEKQLIESLHFDGNEDNISAALEAFIASVHKNDSIPAATDCYAILYVELYRLVSGFCIDAALPSAPNVSNENNLEMLEECLRRLCLEINHRLRGQRATRAIASAAIRYVNENYRQELTLSGVAERIGVSAAYLSAQFHQATGLRFTDYIHKLRIEAAKEIIAAQPCLKGYEVGEMVGYQSSKYFYQKFDDVTGISFYQYRGQFSSEILASF